MIDGAYTNVKDHGAVGNGIADDTNAIKAAVVAAVAAKNITANYCGGFAGILNASSFASDVVVVANILNPATIEVNGTVSGFLLTNADIQISDVFFTPQSLPAGGSAEGQTVYDSATKKLYCWNGTSWNALF